MLVALRCVTVADSVNESPVFKSLSFTDADPTTRSGCGSATVTVTDDEQLFVVSDSPVTVSTQAP